jgi:serine/threonine protein kinase
VSEESAAGTPDRAWSTSPFRLPGYEVGKVLGRGGFGVVFGARDEAFNRAVAIKVLFVAFDDDSHARFDRERFAMGAVSGHPNIVDVYTSGYDELGRPYLVMELMTGGSFADRIRRRGGMSWQAAVDVAVKLAGALETAHRAGVLHRDIKPANVLMSAYGEPQLADFGISRIEASPAQNSGSAITFTPLYAAPELLSGRPASPESEVYALAATLFAMISGSAAFQRDDDAHLIALLHRVATEPLPDLRERGVPEPVWRVIERAMAKDPIERQRSAARLGDDLRRAQEALGLRSTAMHVLVDFAALSFTGSGARTSSERRDRPGARLASRPLHFIWIVDTSESMAAAGKLDALDHALREALSSLRDVAADNPHAEVLVRCLTFSSGVEWAIAAPTAVEDVASIDLHAGGYTDMGAALAEVAGQMRVPPMEPRSLPPALVLISDGRPTDDFSAGLRQLMAEPWGAKAVRLAVAIGGDADQHVLARFIGRPDIKPFAARNATELVHLVRWASTVASRVASAPRGEETEPEAIEPPPIGHRAVSDDGVIPSTW